jgi:predicted GTPase
MSVVTLQKELENIVAKHQNIIGLEAKNLRVEHSIGTVEELEERIEEIENENRVLQIGILGRVKAGKSSLLNALLFEGKSILPKAATPMTAALTIISYGEELSAEVEFFKREDIENIKQEAEEYKREFEKLKHNALKEIKERRAKKAENNLPEKIEDKVNELLNPKELNDKAEKKAKRELKANLSLTSSYDQWQRIEASEIDYTQIAEYEMITGNSLEDLSEALMEFVGADGRYMPFTKSVHIKIPQENLKGIQIVDTPGVNDPVQSREERTREYLKKCDVVFIVSPSGQFMSSEDLDLMDRITSKEGIRELYAVASQIDMQLHGNVKEKSNGNLQKALAYTTETLAQHMHDTLVELKRDHQEVEDAYDSLIESSSKKIIHSSGICTTIKESFDHREEWDDGVKTAWGNLVRNYPNYFSDTDEQLSIANLDLVANIESIQSTVDTVRNQKEIILGKRKQEIIDARLKTLGAYKDALLSYIDDTIEEIKRGNIEELMAERENLNKIRGNVSDVVDNKYDEMIEELELNIKDELDKKLQSYFREARKNIDNSEGSETEEYRIEKEGLFSKGARFLNLGGYEERTRTVVTVKTSHIYNAIDTLTEEVEYSISELAKRFLVQWKKNLSTNLVKTLREHIDDEDLNITLIKKVIRNVLNAIVYPDMSYANGLPSSLLPKGTLKGSRAEKYYDDAHMYVQSLRRRVRNDIKDFVESLIYELENIKISESLFGHYDEMLQKLEEQINNKQLTLDQLARVKKELSEVA